VHGGGGVRWLYGSRVGRVLESVVLSRRFVSRLMGVAHDSRWSRRMIRSFIQTQSVEMAEFEREEYGSFNDFFIRKFQAGAREFVPEPGVLPAFAEARYLAWGSTGPEHSFPVKGEAMTPATVLGPAPPESNVDLACLEGGPLLLARLCPADYHRYHYPDSGKTLRSWTIPGRYHAVNPMALAALGDVFPRNERRVSILETDHMGTLAFVEVGALGVGKIVQSRDEAVRFSRGDEKGYFLFGGSTVMVFGEPGRWLPAEDLLERSSREIETLVRLGEPVGAVPAGD
jgi:phosphatidylserine decarboxylase